MATPQDIIYQTIGELMVGEQLFISGFHQVERGKLSCSLHPYMVEYKIHYW